MSARQALARTPCDVLNVRMIDRCQTSNRETSGFRAVIPDLKRMEGDNFKAKSDEHQTDERPPGQRQTCDDKTSLNGLNGIYLKGIISMIGGTALGPEDRIFLRSLRMSNMQHTHTFDFPRAASSVTRRRPRIVIEYLAAAAAGRN
ncbi:hypothetical protein Bbelb_340940 [Branchiostoma belcheri]|nr:hypothetical protein Bbelb_340940 [Branchiostoma belcheri]